MRPVEVLEALPFAQSCFQVDASFVAEEQAKFLPV